MNMDPEARVLQVDNNIDELSRIADFIEQLGGEWSFQPSLTFQLNLVLEEAFANIVSYGYDDVEVHRVEILFSYSNPELSITICDDGHEYDPTQRAELDITLPAEERPVGGLGIYLIRKFMDSVEYRRIDNKNYLILSKKTGIETARNETL